jgi:hypothetical protein
MCVEWIQLARERDQVGSCERGDELLGSGTMELANEIPSAKNY